MDSVAAQGRDVPGMRCANEKDRYSASYRQPRAVHGCLDRTAKGME